MCGDWVFSALTPSNIPSNSDYSAMLININTIKTLPVNKVNGIVFSDIPLTFSKPGSCFNYYSNPFGRSSGFPYSFTQDSSQNISLTSPF